MFHEKTLNGILQLRDDERITIDNKTWFVTECVDPETKPCMNHMPKIISTEPYRLKEGYPIVVAVVRCNICKIQNEIMMEYDDADEVARQHEQAR